MNNILKILLVDDSDDDTIIIKEAFSESSRLEIIKTVEDGSQAMRFLRKEGAYHDALSPEIVLLDINMPVKNGFETLQEIKKDPNLKHLPIIMLTTSKREEDILRSYEYGANSYILKPVELSEFFETVKNFEKYWTIVSKIQNRGKR